MSTTAVHLRCRKDLLEERVRLLYWAFRRYKLAAEIEPDPAFPGFCDDRPLRSEPLHRLPPTAFDRYLSKAITTWGSVDDFKHFLPRMLELIVNASEDNARTGINPFMIFGRIRIAEWRHWPTEEQQALDGYFEALWATLLATPQSTTGMTCGYYSADNWLEDVSNIYVDLTPFLRQWEIDAADPNSGWVAAEHLANTIVDARDTLLKHDRLRWHNILSDVPERQMTAWLASKTVSRLLEDAFFRWADLPSAAVISEGHFWQEWWLKRRSGVA